MKEIIGYCRLCGELKPLSEEHIPPRSAFNDRHILFETMQDALGISGRRYSKSPNGIKRYSLCENCNNLTGIWYAPDFIEWSKQGYIWLDKLPEESKLSLPYHLRPLNVIKQVVVMLLGVSTEKRLTYYEELRRFVLNREQKYLPSNLRVYAYFNKGGKPRFSDVEAVITRVDLGTMDYVNAEIALPPFGYCITSTSNKKSKSLPEQQGLYEITWFSEFDYNIWTSIYLKLPLRETQSPFPLDYRTEREIKAEYKTGSK